MSRSPVLRCRPEAASSKAIATASASPDKPPRRRSLSPALPALLLALGMFGTPARASLPDDLATAAPVTESERSQLTAGASCAEHARERHGGTLAERQLAMQREVLAFQNLAEEALTMRARAIRLLDELRAKAEGGKPLSGQDLQRLNQGAAAMLDRRAALFKVSLAHECWLDESVPDEHHAAAIQATGITMSLAAALLLYDNYLSAISLYRTDPVLRKHLNRADSGFAIREGELNRIALSFASPDNRSRVRRGIAWFEKHGRGEKAETDSGYRYLAQLVEQSPARQIIRQVRPAAFLGNMAGFLTTISADTLIGLKNEGVHISSLLFGNAVGLVESRRGKLDGRPEVLERVAKSARAGDILLEKTPFRLTDTFIPGHWGHAAIWVGSESELRELGIWDHPVVRAYHAEIRAGRGVVEALRAGVVMNPLRHFLNIDDLALLRQGELSDSQRAEVILQTLRQVGKAYDFNFDAQTTDRIVCSELVYHAYGHLDWPTARHLGRVTISPDNIAVRAIAAGPLNVELLFHDGEAIDSAPRQFMERLVKVRPMGLAQR